jgi:hypothetical protein
MALDLKEIGLRNGLEFHPYPGPFQHGKSTLVGLRRGLLVSFGSFPDGKLGVLVRFQSCSDSPALLAALKADAAMKQISRWAHITMGSPQSVVWKFSKPFRFDQDKFKTALDGMLEIVLLRVSPFPAGKCEFCGSTVKTLTLANGIPNLMCQGCRQRATQDQDSKRREYEASTPNTIMGFLYGLAAAAVLAVAWGFLAYFDTSDNMYHPKLHCLVAGGMALVICLAIKKGMGRIAGAGYVLAFLLTAASKLAGDTLWFALLIDHEQHLQMSKRIMEAAAQNLFAFRWEFSPLTVVCDVFFVALAPLMLRGMRPKFGVAFQEIPIPGG